MLLYEAGGQGLLLVVALLCLPCCVVAVQLLRAWATALQGCKHRA
jgi:hypothetical protein